MTISGRRDRNEWHQKHSRILIPSLALSICSLSTLGNYVCVLHHEVKLSGNVETAQGIADEQVGCKDLDTTEAI